MKKMEYLKKGKNKYNNKYKCVDIYRITSGG